MTMAKTNFVRSGHQPGIIKKKSADHETANPMLKRPKKEDIDACLNCTRTKCSGTRDCMKKREEGR